MKNKKKYRYSYKELYELTDFIAKDRDSIRNSLYELCEKAERIPFTSNDIIKQIKRIIN